jgi:shikimate kinase
MSEHASPSTGTDAAGSRAEGGAFPPPGLADRLGRRAIVLVGMMGVGKTTVGRRLAHRLDLPFRDADTEIEVAAGMPVADIFASYGEAAFRDGEQRVIARLLEAGPLVLATGGGAFMREETRRNIARHGISVWLTADHATLMRRVRRRGHRPLLRTPNPEETMRRLMAEREPVYALADVSVTSCDGPHDQVASRVLRALNTFLAGEALAR